MKIILVSIVLFLFYNKSCFAAKNAIDNEQNAPIVFDKIFTLDDLLTPTTCIINMETAERGADLCAANAYEQFCESENLEPEKRNSPDVDVARKIYKTLMDKYEAQPLVQNEIQKFKDRDPLFYFQSKNLKNFPRDEIIKLHDVQRDLIKDGVLPFKPAVLKNYQEAYKTFINGLSSSRLLSKKNIQFLKTKLDQCINNVEFTGQMEFGAAALLTGEIKTTYDREIDEALKSGHNKVKINLEQDHLDCKVTMSGEIWFQCAMGTAPCFQILFHEFSHFLNPCFFKELSYAMTELADKEHNNDKQNIYLAKKKNYDQFADDLMPPTASQEKENCLELMSRPKKGVLNTCVKTDSLKEKEDLERCGIAGSTIPSKPSQWIEANADFWSGTFLSQWLKKQDLKKRRDALEQVARFYCRQKSELKNIGPKIWNLTSFAYPEENSKPTMNKSSTEKDCQWIEANPGSIKEQMTYWDEHQENNIRFNVNFMRNSDLRKSLGCPLSKDIPMACSPLGTISTILLQ